MRIEANTEHIKYYLSQITPLALGKLANEGYILIRAQLLENIKEVDDTIASGTVEKACIRIALEEAAQLVTEYKDRIFYLPAHNSEDTHHLLNELIDFREINALHFSDLLTVDRIMEELQRPL
jgi:hypothetical protein